MARTHVYTDLSGRDVLYLEANGTRFEITQFVATWPRDGIPQAQCLVAVGRRTSDVNRLAGVHTNSRSLRRLSRCKVWFEPVGDYDVTGKTWPAGPTLLFDGYVLGLSFRKSYGKLMAVFNLAHWLIDLTFGTCLTPNSHPANPTDFTAAAVNLHFGTGAQASEPAYLSAQIRHDLISSTVAKDFWGGVKDFFCKIATLPPHPAGPEFLCLGGRPLASSTRALSALARIEGGSLPPDPRATAGCGRKYQNGVPLKLAVEGLNVIEETVASAITYMTTDSFAGTNFWEKIVGQILPAFGLTLVPRVEDAFVAAFTPTLSRHYRSVPIVDYEAQDFEGEVPMPLRAVGVLVLYASPSGAGQADQVVPGPDPIAPGERPLLGGCYVPDQTADDGAILYVTPPLWLSNIPSTGEYVRPLTGLGTNQASPDATRPGPGLRPAKASSGELAPLANKLFTRYARHVYVENVLRGRVGVLSGRLRFDIAPASNLRIEPSDEVFIGGEDELFEVLYGCVSKVTVAINCEAQIASTSYELTHLRLEVENVDPRTSVEEHPLFGNSIHGNPATGSALHHGAPLLDKYDPDQF